MVFSSTLFLFYFLPVFLLLYFALDPRYKNLWIVIASTFFYAWGAPNFVFIILASIVFDYLLCIPLYKSSGKTRKLWLFLGISVNVGLLVYFKYANFFVDNFNPIFQSLGIGGIKMTQVLLPLGISFFTFHKLSYIIDIYRKVKPPFTSIVNYFLYILFFPQLIAGPIIRYNEIASQINDRRDQENINNKITGFFRFSIGLAKKALIANTLGRQADLIFSLPPDALGFDTAWLGLLAYTFQIYFDFSGYSDMAIGLARMLGFVFPENFNNPYIARNFTEFWHRWHMTLSRWMRDYLFLPLATAKQNPSKAYLYVCLWVVFLISGFWHGASWTFVIWGIYHGLFLVLDKIFLLRLLRKAGKFPSVLLTFFLVMIGWVFFRSSGFDLALDYIGTLFSFRTGNIPVYFSPHFFAVLIAAVLFSFLAYSPKVETRWQALLESRPGSLQATFLTIGTLLLLFFSSVSIHASGFNPFIYFRF